MERRFVLFLVLSFGILSIHFLLNPPRPVNRAKAPQGPQPAAQDGPVKDGPVKDGPGEEGPGEEGPQKEPEDDGRKPPEKPREEPPEPPKPPPQDAPNTVARRWGTLGSADPDDPFRMLVAWDNRGAALTRVELNSDRYRDLQDRSGFLGHLVADESAIGKDHRGKGCLVQMVGPGTPAAGAGLKAGDLIRELRGKNINQKISSVEGLHKALAKTRPNKKVTLTVERDGRQIKLEVTLGRRPLEVIRPEADDPPSFLLTLQQIDDQQLSREDDDDSLDVGKELAGLDLWKGNWEVGEADQSHVVFRRVLPKWDLEIIKSYRLAKVPDKSIKKHADYKAYHLELEVKIRNVGQAEREVAYQLDGPTGLPVEGAWYTRKISRSWGGVGQRDTVVSFDGGVPSLIGCSKIGDDKVDSLPWKGRPLSYIGVDAQYFSCVLLPQKKDPSELRFAQSQPLRVGEVDEKNKMLTNTSCRLVSQASHLAASGQPGHTLAHRFVIFAGPKKPDLLAQYDGLDGLVYYGWFGFVARPMSVVLHFFYGIVRNYGLAILMLTILVRGCMFPLSRKQALGARKMQELQPEIKRLQERYKKDMEGRTKAQQELFRKHNYNPLSGCLVLFFQLPVFIGLYRSLMVDIELRGAPLLWEGFFWCPNLAAPDMLFDWTGFMPQFIAGGRGILGLGPYFNILPIFTVVLFIVQQKMFMPPAADEKTAMQQNMMKYMMVFMGLLFFKVASGLCIYFIASSLWGLAERKFLPNASPASSDAKPATRADAKARDKPREKPRPKPAPPQALSDRDGNGARRKKSTKRGKR